MTTFDEIEQERETYIERTGYAPDLSDPDGPTGDGRTGRYCVVAVYADDRRKVLSRWSTSTMAAKIAGKVAEHGGAFSFIGVSDETDPERGWMTQARP
jgi:hypothetical protein